MASYANYQKAKEGPYLIPSAEILTMVQARLYEDELRKAIDAKKLRVYFQPIYSLEQRKTVSAEALLRIPFAPFHRISPELYIPIAERTGLINEIGLYVFEEVCKYLASGSKQIAYIELNISPYQFMDSDLINDFESLRKKYGVPSSKIDLEITETGGILDKEAVLKAVQRFKALGYTLSLDDFGTGYSNFVRVIRCKFENIKIDKSILWNIEREENGLKTLRSLASFVKMQGARIVQEGVESKDQLAIAKSCGIDYIQGFYFSEALPKEKFDDYLARESL
jgi:EAL domain-containing protein (putative c-di-GMP-specific phosphodiesterase class I)